MWDVSIILTPTTTESILIQLKSQVKDIQGWFSLTMGPGKRNI